MGRCRFDNAPFLLRENMPEEKDPKAVTKLIDGKERPVGDFLVVEDEEKPSTWHLPVRVGGKLDHRLMGAAWAALHGGYRGNKYEGPGKQDAIAVLRKLYEQEDMEPPSTKAANSPDGAMVALYLPPEVAQQLAQLDSAENISEEQFNLLKHALENQNESLEPLSAKAGARHSRMDMGDLQMIHDKAVALGANCDGYEETKAPSKDEPPPEPVKATNALKAISKTDDQLIVGNYLALFNGRDLEGLMSDRVNGDGSRGEYFSKNTKFDSDYTDNDTVIEDWEHGLMPESDGPGRDDILGKVLWDTAKTDDDGLWVKRVLNRRNRFIKLLEPLIEAGLIGTSSEAVPEGVQKASDGEILTWPLRRDTLTVTPMEPRNLDENCLLSLKALAEDIPQIKNACNACGIDLDCSETGEGDGGPSRQERATRIKAKAKARLRLMEMN